MDIMAVFLFFFHPKKIFIVLHWILQLKDATNSDLCGFVEGYKAAFFTTTGLLRGTFRVYL